MNNIVIVCAQCGGDVSRSNNSTWWCDCCQDYVSTEEGEE